MAKYTPKIRGKKIKRARNLYKKKKSGFRKTVETVIFALVAAGLCFVGYAAGKPLLKFISGDTNPAYTDDIPASASGSESESTDPPVTSAATEPSVTTTAPITKSVAYAVYAPPNVLTGTAALSAFLETAKSGGYEAAVIEMKDAEGRLLYKSEIDVLVGLDEINAGVLTAAQIASSCNGTGIKPIARINTLMDRIAPSKFKDVSYRFSDGTSWLDNRREDGGKLWANPFLPGTVSYIKELTAELYNAGFGDIVFANLTFPNMREYDMSILPPEVSDMKTRYSALAEVIASAHAACPNANIMTEMSIADVIANGGPVGTAEILRNKSVDFNAALIVAGAAELNAGGEAAVTADLSELVKNAYATAEKIVGVKIIPCVDGSALSDADKSKVAAALASAGYAEYMARN